MSVSSSSADGDIQSILDSRPTRGVRGHRQRETEGRAGYARETKEEAAAINSC